MRLSQRPNARQRYTPLKKILRIIRTSKPARTAAMLQSTRTATSNNTAQNMFVAGGCCRGPMRRIVQPAPSPIYQVRLIQRLLRPCAERSAYTRHHPPGRSSRFLSSCAHPLRLVLLLMILPALRRRLQTLPCDGNTLVTPPLSNKTQIHTTMMLMTTAVHSV